MDVRCDRCQTEYELDDESVAGAGASVQCTTCGHTFVVSRAGSITIGTTPPSGLSGSDGVASGGPRISQTGQTPPPVAEWVLATEEGQTHRLRDLTMLQKWVVERRVSRADRVSNRGGAWRPLGELDELRPFFDIVEQADRQTGNTRAAAVEAARNVRPTMPATPRNKVQNPGRPHMSPDLDDDDVLSHASSARGGRVDPGRFIDTDIGSDEDLSLSIKPRRTGLKVLAGLAIVGLAAGAWYVGFHDPHGFHLASGTPVPATPPAAPPPAVTPPPPATPPPAPAPAATPPAPAAVPAPTAAAPAPSAAAPVAVPVPPAPVPTPPPAAAAPPPVAAPAPPPPPPAPTAASAAAAPRTYERLVSEADRALENGQTVKAQKMYDEALRMQPNGVAAMTGSAYILMDKRRPLAAIGLFKQALSNAPNYAPALFGLGEAYRGQGDTAQAVDAYKRYLEQSPTGSDAPAARRQIKELGDAASGPRNQGPAAVVPSGTSETSPPPN